jgi:hypothetical protein
MLVSTAFGRIGQVARKVEGLVLRLDRGSSNLPGRISHYRDDVAAEDGTGTRNRSRVLVLGGAAHNGCPYGPPPRAWRAVTPSRSASSPGSRSRLLAVSRSVSTSGRRFRASVIGCRLI